MVRNASQSKTKPSVPKVLTVAATVMALTSTLCFLGAVESFRLRSMYRMVKHGAWAEGFITGKTERNGGNVFYSFQADNRIYTGRGGMVGGIDRVRVGDRVSVVYDPENPAMSSLGRADQYFWDMIVVLAVTSVVFGIFCSVFYTPFWYVWRKRKMNSQ